MCPENASPRPAGCRPGLATTGSFASGSTENRVKAAAASVFAEQGEPDPVIAAYLRDIDRTLIRANLALSVEGRLRNLQALLDFADELQRAGGQQRRS
jgi:hypothetical protein